MMATHVSRQQALSLMTLPVEVREVIYRYVFSYNKPLYTAKFGRLAMDQDARRDMQCLRTCMAFYCEAVPQIHAINTLEIDHDSMSALAWVPRSAEILASKVIVQCYQPINALLATGGRPGRVVEEIDFGLLGQVCPNVNDIEIHTHTSGSLLWLTQKLLKSLPCSSIREWPLLRVEVEVADEDPDLFDNDSFGTTGDKKIVYGVATDDTNFSWLNARSSFGLGHEVPRYLKSIVVYGRLSRRLCRMLEGHACSFGDCSFQKETLTSAPAEQIRYTWHKSGEPVPLDEAYEAKVMSAMNQWVRR